MKTLKILALINLSLFFFCLYLHAACIEPHAFGTHDYHYVIGIPDGVPPETIETIFYIYEYYGGDYIHNDMYDWQTWFVNKLGVWYTTGDWANNGVTACPLSPCTTNHHVQMISYDNDLNTATNVVTYAVFGAPWNPVTTKYDFDQIIDGDYGSFGGGPCCVLMQPIPQITINSVSGLYPDYVYNLDWIEPVQYSYGGSGHPEYVWGYRVYYTTTPWDGIYGNVVYPTSNANWTPVSTGGDVPIGSYSATVTTPHDPGTTIFFALSVVGYDSWTGGPAPLETHYAGQCSTDYVYLSYLPYPAPNGESPTTPLLVNKLTTIGDQIEVSWDSITCPSQDYRLLYGELSNVGSYLINDDFCWISNPYTWSSVPSTDMFFIIVGISNYIYVPDILFQSSWGTNSNGVERDGTILGWNCDDPDTTLTKNTTNTCP